MVCSVLLSVLPSISLNYVEPSSAHNKASPECAFMAAVCYDVLGEISLIDKLYCLLFSFSSSVTFGDIKNKAKFIIVTGDNFDWFTYQNDLLYKILIHWGWMMA